MEETLCTGGADAGGGVLHPHPGDRTQVSTNLTLYSQQYQRHKTQDTSHVYRDVTFPTSKHGRLPLFCDDQGVASL